MGAGISGNTQMYSIGLLSALIHPDGSSVDGLLSKKSFDTTRNFSRFLSHVALTWI